MRIIRSLAIVMSLLAIFPGVGIAEEPLDSGDVEPLTPPALQGCSIDLSRDQELIVVNVAGDTRAWKCRVATRVWEIDPAHPDAGVEPVTALFRRAFARCDRSADPTQDGWMRPLLLIEFRADGAAPVAAVMAIASAIRIAEFLPGTQPATAIFSDGTDHSPAPGADGKVAARLLPRPIPEGVRVTVHAPDTPGNETAVVLPWLASEAPPVAEIFDLVSDGGGTRVTPPSGTAFTITPHLSAAAPAEQSASLKRVSGVISAELLKRERKLADRADLPPIVVRAQPGVAWSDVVAVLDAALAYEGARTPPPPPGKAPEIRRAVVVVVPSVK